MLIMIININKFNKQMYVCVCNSIKDKDFAKASVDKPNAKEAEELFSCLGCSPKCGTCLCYINESFLNKRELKQAAIN